MLLNDILELIEKRFNMVTLVVYVDKYEKSFNEYEWIFSNPFEVQENIKFVEKGSYVKIWRVNYVFWMKFLILYWFLSISKY